MPNAVLQEEGRIRDSDHYSNQYSSVVKPNYVVNLVVWWVPKKIWVTSCAVFT